MTPPFSDRHDAASTTTSVVDIDHVWVSCRTELEAIEQHITQSISSCAPLINEAATYLLKSGGKRIRPLLLILSSRLCDRQASHDEAVLLASAVEYIHTAALLHDDVLDDAALRRGHDTARLLWGNKASILVGDYLYTRAVDQVIRLGNGEIESALAEACRKMVEGEILQHSHRHNIDISEQEYFKIIEGKTASLISAACLLGAIHGQASTEGRDALAQFGRLLGLAFQVADDALDYAASSDKLGKTIGTDLHEGKITLPLLHLLSICRPMERQAIQQVVEQNGTPRYDLETIIQLMDRYGSVAYARDRSRQLISLAVEELRLFPPSPHREALEVVAEFAVARDH